MPLNVVVWFFSLASAFDPFALEGTQPYDLNIPLAPADDCESCHGNYAESPTEAWKGTMMANAVRDPLFLAALTIAEQDVPDSGNFCLRCHTPNGWLEGRCLPGDGSNLNADDIDSGVSCDACHRMTEGEQRLTGNAQYTVDQSSDKRGLIGTSYASHGVAYDPYLESGDMCGVCHEVSNPTLDDFPIELTWTEWSNSAFAVEGESCQDCHMKTEPGYAANTFGLPVRTVNIHRFVGGNAWIPEVMAAEFPELEREAAYLQTAADARALLQEAATLEVLDEPPPRPGGDATVTIRVENLTGHKLPSGYPEGRRAWLEVWVEDAAGNALVSSGVYDPVDADLPSDAYLRVYQALLGVDGQQNYHMVYQDELLEDTRIPPRGFYANDETQPVGREYALQADGTMIHWDDAPYSFFLPQGTQGPLTVRATLWYQTTTKAFVTFLRDENVTDDRGDEMYRMWETYGKSPPEFMASTTASIDLGPPVQTLSPLPIPDEEEDKKGCLCAVSNAPAGTLALWLIVGGIRRRRTRR